MPKLHVLVVDDNATSRNVLHHMLEGWGLRHTCAAKGPEALDSLQSAAAQKDPFDVAVVDAVMPGMNGMDLVRAIRSVAVLADLRVMLLSAMVRQGEAGAEDAEPLGIECHLHKPVRRSRLYDGLTNKRSQPVRFADAEPSDLETPVQRLKVLVAEDNPVNQELAVAMLEVIGCRVDVVDNGEQAVAAVSAVRYDVVFMDCQMPEMDGLEATRRIRGREAGVGRASTVSLDPARIPIVALTAHAMQGDRGQCLAAGMDDYLTKPFRQDELAAVLSRWTSTVAQPVKTVPVTAGYRG